jgi:NADPH:quinone reductase-like Zn-dependent oxidoreductase
MKAIVGKRYGPPDVLELREVDKPVIEDDQVLVGVHASSVNPAEWYRVHGPFFMRPSQGIRRPKHARLGNDLAGRVEAVGKDIKEFQAGDEVFGTGLGAWAEYAVARESHLVRKPANVSFEEAAAVPIAAITALQALRDHARVQPGQKLLIKRRVRRCRHLRRPAREVVRSSRDRRVQHSERRARLLARGRPRGRLHAGGLHPAR